MTQPPSPNPFRSGLDATRRPDPCAIVIFGATGDLTRRKLLPAIYNLAQDGLLPPRFSLVGFARRPKTDAEFRAEMKAAVDEFSRRRPAEPATWTGLASAISYHQSAFDDAAGYAALKERLARGDAAAGTSGNRLFYLATPPSHTQAIVDNLGRAGLVTRANGGPWSRVIIEKPFGRDLESARLLNTDVHGVIREDQTYRIDHYLGKETVQNILAFRFANGIFEPLWNRKNVDHVQITVSEDIGVEGRGAFYEEAGILRDIFQNHMLQLLCLMAMEPPVAFDADAIRDEKMKVLRAIRPMSPEEVLRNTIRGQYAAGSVKGERVPGYRDEPGVARDSAVETFAAVRLGIDNWRWSGVPFYLRTGKRLAKRVTEIAIVFQKAPNLLFETAALDPNVLVLRIQPDEGISLKFASKVPGLTSTIRPVLMDFRYGTSFGVEPPEAYERLILDSMIGDSTLFTRADEVEAAWEIVTPILGAWRESVEPPLPYEGGSWGPDESEGLLLRDGRSWRRL